MTNWIFGPEDGKLSVFRDDTEVSHFGSDGVFGSDGISVGNVTTTVPSDGVSEINSKLSNLGTDEALAIIHPVTVATTSIKIPSNTALIISAPVVREDNIDQSGTNMVENLNKETGDENIKLLFEGSGYLDGNAPNQPTGHENRFPTKFINVNNIEIRNADIRRHYNFATRMDLCDRVQISDYHSNCDDSQHHEDGIHFVDTSNISANNLLIRSEDDCVAITADTVNTVENINIQNLVGTSHVANGVRINKAGADIGNGTERRFKNIHVQGVIYGPAESGIILQAADADTYYEQVSCDITVTNARRGMTLGGNHIDGDYTVRANNLEENGIYGLQLDSTKNTRFSGVVRNPGASNYSVLLGTATDSIIDMDCYRDSSNTNDFKGHVVVEAGARVEVSGHYDGGDRIIKFGSGSSSVEKPVLSNATVINANVRSGSPEVHLHQASDVNILNSNLGSNTINTGPSGNSPRPRWNGVIYGGILGGVDLSTVTGQYEGDKAMSNGTNGTAYVEATWTGSSWQLSDGSATI